MKLRNILTAAAIGAPIAAGCASSQKQEHNPEPLSEFNERVNAILADAGDGGEDDLDERLESIFSKDAGAPDAP